MERGEMFFRLGVAVLVLAVILIVISLIVFFVNGRKLRKTLKEEYGEPWRYNIQ